MARDSLLARRGHGIRQAHAALSQPKGGVAIGNRHLGVRFARGSRASPPPVHPRKHDHDEHAEHRHAYRPQKSSFNLAFGLIIAVAAVGLIAILALVGREEPASFNELKAELGIPITGSIPTFDLEQVDFVNRLDRIGCARQAETFEGRYVYLYYKVREGQAQIILDRGAWHAGKARIRQLALR